MEIYENMKDEDIVEKVRNSDKELYAFIIKRYQNKLLRYANNIIKNNEKAVDVVQESFIKAFINLNNFDTKKNFSSWIYRIVHNEAVNIIKKYKMETPLLTDWDFISEEDIEGDLIKNEEINNVEVCIKKLPLLYSEPLSLYYIDEKSYEEISDILKIPMGTVAIRISRAKKLMKNICLKN